MVSIASLWLPILLSAVGVFVLSSIIHMLMPYHQKDVDEVPDESALREALGALDLPPGDYVVPRAHSGRELSDPAFVAKMEEGPVAFLTVRPNGPPKMGKQLALWFAYCILVGIFSAYIAGRALGPGAEYLSVFQFAGATAFFCYAAALWHMPIFYGKKWAWLLTFSFDGLLYSMVTAGFFGWLWPA